MSQHLIGAMIHFTPDAAAMENEFAQLERLELNACQLGIWAAENSLTKEQADMVRAAAERHGVTITAVWAGWRGPAVWNFTEGPSTLGIVPEQYRADRIADILERARFAELLGVTDVITHCGFLPENPCSPEFGPVADAIAKIAFDLKARGQWFLFETGQETPVTMLRFIETVNSGNLGVNLDTANLILYGKANTVDSLDVFGDYVRNTHFKDGFYPTTGKELGRECALGEGKANVPGVIAGLRAHGYRGPYIIEREISGDQQVKDILLARDLIRSCL